MPGDIPRSHIERKRDERVRRILSVTAGLLGERGYAALNLDEVAELLDVRKSALYYYFPTKEALVGACLAMIGDELTTRLEAVYEAGRGLPLEDQLRRLMAEQLRIVLADAPHALPLFLQPGAWPQAHRKLLKQLRTRHDRLFRVILAEGVDAGEFALTSVEMTLHCLYGALNYAPVWYRGRTEAQLAKVVAELGDTVIRMVRS